MNRYFFFFHKLAIFALNYHAKEPDFEKREICCKIGDDMNILFLLLPKNQVDYLFADFTVRQALEKLEAHRYSMIPIIDRKSGKYERSLMEGDFLYYLTQHQLSFSELEKLPLVEVPASRTIKAVGVNCQIQELYDKIVDQNFVPVIDDKGVFIGIVTRKAVMRTLLGDQIHQ